MKKTTLLTMMAIFCGYLNCKAQESIALEISKKLENKDKQITPKGKNDQDIFDSEISHLKKSNNFIFESSDISQVLSLGSNWQSMVINGATDFLIDRAKQEVQASFILELKNVFGSADESSNNKKFLKAAFPNFKKTVEIVSESYSKNYLSMLHAAILEDYKNLPAVLFSKAGSVFWRKGEFPVDDALANSLIKAVQEILKGANPALSLSKLETANTNVQIKKAVEIIRTLAKESYEVSTMAATFEGRNLSELMSSSIFRDRFFESLENVCKIDIPNTNDIDKANWKLAAIEIIHGIQSLSNYTQKIKEAETDSARRVLYGSFLSSFATTLRVAGDLVSDEEGEKNWQKAMDYLDHAVNMYQSILAKDYHKVLVQMTSLMDEVYLEQRTFKVLTFAANLAEVKSREDMELALQAFALPVGSFRMKRLENEPRGYAMLNAYLGYSGGMEWLIPSDGIPTAKMSYFQGLCLPVGVEFGTSTGKRVISSVGLFMSPIDLGTMASYRMGQDSVGSLKVNNRDQISFRNIFSPSAMLTFGISRNKPITLAIGGQYAPEQRTLVNTNLNTNSDIAVWRVFATLAVDLSLFRF